MVQQSWHASEPEMVQNASWKTAFTLFVDRIMQDLHVPIMKGVQYQSS